MTTTKLQILRLGLMFFSFTASNLLQDGLDLALQGKEKKPDKMTDEEFAIIDKKAKAADFDLTGQLVWPGAELLNGYLTKNANMLQGCSVIELGSGVGITGVLCSRFCREVVMTDHNEEVLKILNKNIKLQESSDDSLCCAELKAEKLEWGNSDQLNHILQQRPEGFDLVLGEALSFQQANVPLLFDTVEQLFRGRDQSKCKFILGYVSRAKVMDAMVIDEAIRHGLQINEVSGTRCNIKNHEGVIFEIATNH
ncbi:protein-lysine N-methyltransferase EFM3 isoform X2 [Nicotiana tomentosiformis]|uniref:protein-lysine N-methyltransferase EFM3 isoform X2 n=1 Tax=Nicotiana tomentosiformis TaxID=4098 RepID=UPI00388C3CF6